MKTWVRKTLSVGVLAAGALLFAPGMAHADATQSSTGNVGVANGTQVLTKVAVPLNVVGNSIGVAGESNAAGQGINWVESGKYTQKSHHNVGVLNGTQVLVPIDVPVNVVGNAVSVLGVANAAGTGANKTESAKTESSTVDQDSHGNVGALNGTQVAAPINVPVNVCGNSLAILGLSNAQAVCMNGGQSTEGGISQGSSDNVGVGNGTQVALPVYAPINVAGNAAGVLGVANAAGASSNESAQQGGITQDSHGNVGLLNGTQVAAPITIPVNVCGNALAVLGTADAAAACSNGTTGNGGDQGGDQGGDDNGGDQGGYPGDDGDDVGGDGGAMGDGDNTYGEPARKSHAHAASNTEGTAVDGLTQNLSNAGGVNLGGLDVQKLLK